MPKKPAFDPVSLIDIFTSHKSEIIVNNTVVVPSNPIWNKIKVDYNVPMTAKALYTFVKCNSHNVCTSLGLLNVTSSSSEDGTASCTEHVSERNHFSSDEDGCNFLKFDLVIEPDDWNKMKPITVTYNRNDGHSNDQRRQRQILQPGVWTDIINDYVWKKVQVPCTFVFKHSRVSEAGSKYIVIEAHCKQCLSSLEISAIDAPVSGYLHLECLLSGDFGSQHSSIVKRHLRGLVRKECVTHLIDHRQTASQYRREEANKKMELFGDEPSHIPSLEVLRKAKSNAVKASRIDQDPLMSILRLKYSSPYNEYIREIGLDPFFVHYWSSSQLRVYAEYTACEPSTLMVDATGHIVRKLHRPGGIQSGHIFLYCAVIRIPDIRDGQIPIFQMLSERQNTNAITYFFSEWLRCGAEAPKIFVSDFSLALLGAACRAFAGLHSVKEYIDCCFDVLQKLSSTLPRTFIRVDVAHLLKFVSRWKCVRNKPRRVRQFYIRSIAQLVLCDKVQNFETIFKAICVTAFSETEGQCRSTGRDTSCESTKVFLRHLLSTGEVQGTNIPDVADLTSNEVTLDSHCSDFEEETFARTGEWIQNIVECARREATTEEEGNRDNLYCLPELVDSLAKLCKFFPLWTATMVPLFKCGSRVATTSGVESYINDLKSRTMCKEHPRRLEDFIMKHMETIEGQMKLSSAHMHEEERCMKTNNTSNEKEDTTPSDQCPEEEDSDKAQTPPRIVSNPPCAACERGDKPTGAHCCISCKKPVHILEGCSVSVGDEEGYGENRLCNSCHNDSVSRFTTENLELIQTRITQNIEENEEIEDQENINLLRPTCIVSAIPASVSEQDRAVDEEDCAVRDKEWSIPDNIHNELSACENWRGLCLPPRKRRKSFYMTVAPEWNVISMNEVLKKVKIGLLKNGQDISLRSVKTQGKKVCLSNTCAFDAFVQSIAVSYCDSARYRECVNNDVPRDLLDLVVHLTTKGSGLQAYKLRANILSNMFASKVVNGLDIIDCQCSVSKIISNINIPSSLKETRQCSSEFCPSATQERHFSMLRVHVGVLSEQGPRFLHRAIELGTCRDEVKCLMPMTEENVPEEFIYEDKDVSNHKLCFGDVRYETQFMNHLLIDIGGIEADNEVEKLICAPLSDFPPYLKISQKLYCLRSVVAFFPPACKKGTGHYAAYCKRIDGSWELYDDLKHGVLNVKDSTKTTAHLAVYSI